MDAHKDPGSLKPDPRIRIRIRKKSARIRNTGYKYIINNYYVKSVLYFLGGTKTNSVDKQPTQW